MTIIRKQYATCPYCEKRIPFASADAAPDNNLLCDECKDNPMQTEIILFDLAGNGFQIFSRDKRESEKTWGNWGVRFVFASPMNAANAVAGIKTIAGKRNITKSYFINDFFQNIPDDADLEKEVGLSLESLLEKLNWREGAWITIGKFK